MKGDLLASGYSKAVLLVMLILPLLLNIQTSATSLSSTNNIQFYNFSIFGSIWHDVVNFFSHLFSSNNSTTTPSTVSISILTSSTIPITTLPTTISTTTISSGYSQATCGPGNYCISQSEMASLVGTAGYNVTYTANSAFIAPWLNSGVGSPPAILSNTVTAVWSITYINIKKEPSNVNREYVFESPDAKQLYTYYYGLALYKEGNTTLNGLTYFAVNTSSAITFYGYKNNGFVTFATSYTQVNVTDLATIISNTIPNATSLTANQTTTSISASNTTSGTNFCSSPTIPSQNAVNNYLYVTNYVNSTISVIDTQTNRLAATIQLGNSSIPGFGAGPIGLAILPNGKYLYVAESLGRRIAVINTTTNKIIKLINLSFYEAPGPVVVTPNGNCVYVASEGYPSKIPSTLTVINALNNLIITNITIGNTTEAAQIGGLAVSPDNRYVYLAESGHSFAYTTNPNAGESKNIWVINTSTNNVSRVIISQASPGSLVVSPDGKYLYVEDTYPYSFNISTIDIPNGTISTVPSPAYDSGLAISPDGQYLYGGYCEFDNGTNEFYTISAKNKSVITTTLINGCPVSYIAISRNGAYAYIVNQQLERPSTIIVLNITNPYTTNSTLVATIPVGFYSQGIALSS